MLFLAISESLRLPLTSEAPNLSGYPAFFPHIDFTFPPNYRIKLQLLSTFNFDFQFLLSVDPNE